MQEGEAKKEQKEEEEEEPANDSNTMDEPSLTLPTDDGDDQFETIQQVQYCIYEYVWFRSVIVVYEGWRQARVVKSNYKVYVKLIKPAAVSRAVTAWCIFTSVQNLIIFHIFNKALFSFYALALI